MHQQGSPCCGSLKLLPEKQGEPYWSTGCGEIGSSRFTLCIMNSVSNLPLTQKDNIDIYLF